MYNKRNMGFLEKEMEKGKHPYLVDLMKLFKEAEKNLGGKGKKALVSTSESLQKIKNELDTIIKDLAMNDEKEWRRDLLLNYYLNLELAYYKNVDSSHTKWTVFLSKLKENHWDVLLQFANKIDQYVSSQDDPNNANSSISEEAYDKIMKEYISVVLPFFKEHLWVVDSFQAELRFEQRLNLLKKKVPIKSKMTFGKWLREKREVAGYSLNDLAERCGYSTAYIFRIEKGTRKNPTPKVISNIIKALGYEPEELLPLFLTSEKGEEASNSMRIEKKLDLTDIIRLNDYSLNNKPVSEKKREVLSHIVKLICEDDVLRAPKINDLKNSIRQFQDLQ